MKSKLLPDYWKDFVNTHSLVHEEIEFPWPGEDDLTAIVEILDDENVERETKELWPGIGVHKDGFIPVAGCGVGTGDQYCINVNDGKNGPLYLVDHERVGEDGYDRADAISIMLPNYEDLLNHHQKNEGIKT